MAVNKCWFKDEKDKKPENFNMTGIALLDGIIKGLLPGLYHFCCHCQEMPIFPASPEEIKLLIPSGKIQYLFTSKKGWVHAMGHYEQDYENFFNILCSKTRDAYFYGKYYIESISKYGCKINLLIDIPGNNEKLGNTYKIESNFMIFPNGKLKMNTPIGGWQK